VLSLHYLSNTAALQWTRGAPPTLFINQRCTLFSNYHYRCILYNIHYKPDTGASPAIFPNHSRTLAISTDQLPVISI
jgi:hypothetical protein